MPPRAKKVDASSAQQPQQEKAAEGPERRLVIKSIVADNFKSYAGVHTIGPFHSTFTAIVGPNGSGKSNVIDSMLFVFGKTAKKLRLDKLSELIHSSQAHPDLNHASVTVHFEEQEAKSPEEVAAIQAKLDEGDFFDPALKWKVVPNTKLTVKREVFKNGHSQYSLNGCKTTQKDVVSQLTAKGVDLDHNRFLILQGEVEQIAMMKPKAEKEGEEGLLEYFDDLIGTNKFVPQINDLTLKTEMLQEQRLALLDTRKKVGAELDALQRAKDQTLGYISKENHLQHLLSVMCQKRMERHTEELKEPLAKIAEHETALKKLEVDFNETEARQAEDKKEENERKDEMKKVNTHHQKILVELNKAEEVLNEVKAGGTMLEKQRTVEQKKLDKARKEHMDEESKLKTAQNDLSIATGHHDEAATHVAEWEPEFEKAQDELEVLMKPLRKKQAQAENEGAPLKRKVTDAQAELGNAKHAKEEMMSAQVQRQQELNRTCQEREANLTKRDAKTKILEGVESSKKAIEEYEAQMEILTTQLHTATQAKNTAEQRINNVKASVSDDREHDKVANFLLGKKDLKGYYGTLRQQGSIPDKFDIAAGTAGTNTWGFHVVKDAATASQCTKLLKDNNVGRASFLVLEQLSKTHGSRMDSKFQTPEGSSRVFDLIKPLEGKFRCAFFHAVKDTLVVKDLSRARELAFGSGKKFRVVTVNGDLVEPTGSLTGGGRPQPARLKAAAAPIDKQKVIQELDVLQKELEKAHGAVLDLDKKIRLIQSEIQKLRVNSNFTPQQLRQLRTEVAQLNAAIEHNTEQEDKLRAQIEAFSTSSESITKQRSLDQEIHEASLRAESAEEGYHKLKIKLEGIKMEMDAIGGAEHTAMRDRLQTEKKRVVDQAAKMSTAKKVVTSATTIITKKTALIAQHEAILQEIAEKAAKAVAEELSDAQAAVDQFTAQSKEKIEVLNKMREGITEMEKILQAHIDKIRLIRKEKESHTLERDEISASIQEVKVRISKFEAKILDCEDKVKDNVRDFGLETLDRNDAGLFAAGEEDLQEEEDDDEVPATAGGPQNRWRRQSGSNLANSTGGSVKYVKEHEIVMETYTTRKTPEQLADFTFEHCELMARELTSECKADMENIDRGAVALWREKNNEFEKCDEEYRTVLDEVLGSEEMMEELKLERKEIFLDKFNLINRELKKMYQMITDGGDAEVELVDTQDPFEGISFVVRPPKKSWKVVGNLSGGEKTLSSLALVFALHHVKPTPIYVMDEIDAALDFKNVSIVARYILEQAVGAQFVIISLRNNMFELAHRLVGISKVRDVTQSVTMDPRAAGISMQANVALKEAGKKGGGAGEASPNAARINMQGLQQRSPNLVPTRGSKQIISAPTPPLPHQRNNGQHHQAGGDGSGPTKRNRDGEEGQQ